MTGRLSNGPVILASGSATRRKMLTDAGLDIVAVSPAVDEDEIKRSAQAAGLRCEEVAEALAELKAARVAKSYPNALVIGADQMLECSGVWFDKPPDADHARAQLKALSGRTHRLVSCAVVLLNGERVWHHVDQASLSMRAMSDDFLDRYLQAAGPSVLHSVGAYQLEGPGAQLFSRVQGDFFTILGLPLLPLLDFLRLRGILPD